MQKRSRAGILIATFGLISCATPSSLDPQIVLQRSAQANQRLQTVEMRAHLFMDDNTTGERTRISIQGQLQNAGTELFAQIAIERQGKPSQTFALMQLQDGSVFITQPEDQETYSYSPKNIHTFTWLALEPPKKQIPPNVMETPLFDVSEKGIRITRDKGMSFLRGKRHFSYLTAIDTPISSQLSLQGELWVDAETFFTSRIVWTIEKKQQRASLTVDLFDHNAVAPFSLPKNIQELSRKDRLELLEQLNAVLPNLLQTLLQSPLK